MRKSALQMDETVYATHTLDDLRYLSLACAVIEQARKDVQHARKTRPWYSVRQKNHGPDDATDAKEFLTTRLWDDDCWWKQMIEEFIPGMTPQQAIAWSATYCRSQMRKSER